MARAVTPNRKVLNTGLAWAIGLVIFFPILWTILTSFKTEAQAIADPPIFLLPLTGRWRITRSYRSAPTICVFCGTL